MSKYYREPFWKVDIFCLVMNQALEHSGSLISTHEPSWEFIGTHEYSWVPMSSHEHSEALMRNQDHKLTLISIHDYGAMAQWSIWFFPALCSHAHEYSWILTCSNEHSAHGCSWPPKSSNEHSWAFMSIHEHDYIAPVALMCTPIAMAPYSWVLMRAHECYWVLTRAQEYT